MAHRAMRAGFGAPVLAVLAATVLLAWPPHAGAAVIWVVAPGSAATTPCTTATPCSYTYALANAHSGDTIQFESGEYDYSGAGNTNLQAPDGVTLEPAPGDATRPLIKQTVPYPVCNCELIALGLNDTVTGLAFDQSVAPAARAASPLYVSPTDVVTNCVMTGFNGVFAFGSATTGKAEVADSTIVASAAGASGVLDEITGGATVNLDNDTILATGAGGDAIRIQELFNPDHSGVAGENTIAVGAGEDLVANAAVIGTIASITMSYSDFRPTAESATGAGSVSITGTDHDISGAPAFASGSYREAAGSPTIRAGEADAASGSTDFEGFPRTTAGATDIGASQYALPVLTAGTPSAIASGGATVNATLNPDGLGTTYTVSYGPTSGYGTTTTGVAVPAATTTDPLAVALAGLAPNTTYHYAITATNAYGSTSTADATFATLAAAPPPLPVISGFALSRTRFAAAPRGGATAAVAPAPIGTRIGYSDSEAATATFTVLAELPGVRRGGLCVKTPPHRRNGSRIVHCTRSVKRGSFTHSDVAGVNGFEFTGRLAGHRLALGHYQLSVRATNSSAEGGLPVTAGFRIVARRP